MVVTSPLRTKNLSTTYPQNTQHVESDALQHRRSSNWCMIRAAVVNKLGGPFHVHTQTRKYLLRNVFSKVPGMLTTTCKTYTTCRHCASKKKAARKTTKPHVRSANQPRVPLASGPGKPCSTLLRRTPRRAPRSTCSRWGPGRATAPARR